MSHSTITRSTRDTALTDRITAAIGREAYNNEAYANSPGGQLVHQAGPTVLLGELLWPCCIAFEAPYEYAINSGNENPGGDPTVITDAQITGAVQKFWPGGVTLIPSFTWQAEGLSVLFTPADLGDATRVDWDFGDGTAPVQGVPGADYEYGADGSYTATMTVTYADSTTTVSSEVTVAA